MPGAREPAAGMKQDYKPVTEGYSLSTARTYEYISVKLEK